MRRVKATKREFISSAEGYRVTDLGEAVFHQWGQNFEEFESGPGNFTTAICEFPDGSIQELLPDDITFLDKPDFGVEYTTTALTDCDIDSVIRRVSEATAREDANTEHEVDAKVRADYDMIDVSPCTLLLSKEAIFGAEPSEHLVAFKTNGIESFLISVQALKNIIAYESERHIGRPSGVMVNIAPRDSGLIGKPPVRLDDIEFSERLALARRRDDAHDEDGREVEAGWCDTFSERQPHESLRELEAKLADGLRDSGLGLASVRRAMNAALCPFSEAYPQDRIDAALIYAGYEPAVVAASRG